MARELGAYRPFSGLSAWFSCSVDPSTVKLWGKCIKRYPSGNKITVLFAEHHGGKLAQESDALYLFSDDTFTKDTTR